MKRLAALAALAASALAHGQSEDAVVVSATRIGRPLLELPLSADRIRGEEIREGRLQVNLSETLGRVPGIYVQNRHNYAQDLQISSRGFGARASFGVRGIRLLADGIPASMPDGQGQAATFALASAERIEVLRGPFASLHGNAAGGVIAVYTQEPPGEPEASISFALGAHGTRRAGLRAAGRAGGIGLLVEASRFESDGWRAHSAVRREHLNAKATATLAGGGLAVVVNSLRQPDTRDPLGLTRAQYEADPRQATALARQFNTRKSVLQDQLGASWSTRAGGGEVQLSLYGGAREVEQYLAIPLATQALPTHSGAVVSLDRGFGGGALRYAGETSLAGRVLRLAAGAEVERMRERRRGYLNVNGVAGALKRDEDDTVTSTDLYAQAEWAVAPRWALHAGLRASRVRFDVRDYFVAAGNPDDSGARTYRAATPAVGVLLRLDDGTALYANVGRGFETPTFAELAHRSGGSGFNFELQPARSAHAEVGAKKVWPAWGRAQAALFSIGTRDEIVVETSAGGRSTFRNAGRTMRRGLELAGETHFGGPVDAAFAWSTLSARYRDPFDTVEGTPPVAVLVPAGNRLPGAPPRQLYAELRYRFAPSGFYALAEYLHRGRLYANDRNTEAADAYGVLNLVAGWSWRDERATVSAFVRLDNATDRGYAGSVIVNEANRRYYEPAPRRSLLLAVRLEARL